MSGKVAAGMFLVDLACLGVKSAQASFGLVAKIIYTGLDRVTSANVGDFLK